MSSMSSMRCMHAILVEGSEVILVIFEAFNTGDSRRDNVVCW